MTVQTVTQHRQERTGPARVTRTEIMALLGLVCLGLCARFVSIPTAYEVYVDEFFYGMLGESVGRGHLPPVLGGRPFLFHPPGFFILEAGWQWMVDYGGDQYDKVFLMRGFQQLLAVVSLVLIYLVVRRCGGVLAASLSAGLFAVDAFVLRQNGRILLETATMMFALGGYLLLTRALREGAQRLTRPGVGAGLLLGLSLLTKDMALFVTVLPLLLLMIRPGSLSRRMLGQIALLALAPYTAYLVVVATTGHLVDLWRAKTSGLSRALGSTVTTGYNADGAPSLLTAALEQVYHFGGSYLLVAASVAAAVHLALRSTRAIERYLGLATLCGLAMLGYGTLVSTIEEHFVYYVEIPGLICVGLVGVRLWRGAVLPGLPRPRVRRGLGVGLVLVAALSLVSWVDIRTTPDNAQQRAYQWLLEHTSDGTVVAWVAGQTEFALMGTTVRTVPLSRPERMVQLGVTHLVVQERTVRRHYSFASPRSVDWFIQRSVRVFTAESPSYDRVSIYQTTDPRVW